MPSVDIMSEWVAWRTQTTIFMDESVTRCDIAEWIIIYCTERFYSVSFRFFCAGKSYPSELFLFSLYIEVSQWLKQKENVQKRSPYMVWWATREQFRVETESSEVLECAMSCALHSLHMTDGPWFNRGSLVGAKSRLTGEPHGGKGDTRGISRKKTTPLVSR